ncbi:hypothetical protein RI367_004027 [Sorochytrium milnesiophthora]
MTIASAAAGQKGSVPETAVTDYTQYFTQTSKARQPSAIRALQPLLAIPGMIALSGGLPNPHTFPIKSMTLTLNDGSVVDISAKDTATALQYGPTPGLPALLDELHKLQEHVHQPHYPVTLCVGNGSQDLMSKAFAMLLERGDPVLVETPCYVGTLAILKPMGVQMHAVDTDAQGIVPASLERILRGWPAGTKCPRVLYTVPTGGNPTGSVATLERKQRVYALAREFGLLIMEDDPYYYLKFDWFEDGGRVPSYLSMDVDRRVLRFESFSKIFSAGVRLGMASGPEPLVQRLMLDTQATSLQPTGTSQMMLLSMLRHWNGLPGFFDHLRTVQAFYKQRCAAMHRIFTKHLSGLAEWSVPTAGMFLWMRVPGVHDTAKLIGTYAKEEKVLLLPGGEFIPPPPGSTSSSAAATPKLPSCQYVRAAFSIASDEQMEEAAVRFKKCIERAMKDE